MVGTNLTNADLISIGTLACSFLVCLTFPSLCRHEQHIAEVKFRLSADKLPLYHVTTFLIFYWLALISSLVFNLEEAHVAPTSAFYVIVMCSACYLTYLISARRMTAASRDPLHVAVSVGPAPLGRADFASMRLHLTEASADQLAKFLTTENVSISFYKSNPDAIKKIIQKFEEAREEILAKTS